MQLGGRIRERPTTLRPVTAKIRHTRQQRVDCFSQLISFSSERMSIGRDRILRDRGCLWQRRKSFSVSPVGLGRPSQGRRCGDHWHLCGADDPATLLLRAARGTSGR